MDPTTFKSVKDRAGNIIGYYDPNPGMLGHINTFDTSKRLMSGERSVAQAIKFIKDKHASRDRVRSTSSK